MCNIVATDIVGAFVVVLCLAMHNIVATDIVGAFIEMLCITVHCLKYSGYRYCRRICCSALSNGALCVI